MNYEKNKILVFTAPMGHLSLAESVISFIHDIPNCEIKKIDFFDGLYLWKVYSLLSRFFPFLIKIPYELTKNDEILANLKSYAEEITRDKILDLVMKEKPDLIISTYFGYNPVLDSLREKNEFKFINLISDPVNVHPILFSHKADYNFGFGEEFIGVGKNLNISSEKMISSGWMTRKDFFTKLDKDKIRKKLNLDDNLTFLVCGGSQGSNAVLSLLPILFFSKFNCSIQIIFICGHNRQLPILIKKIYALAKKVNRNPPKIILEGFTNNVHEFISASDVVFGKAGPNLIFESVAKEKPFVAITHISGQETGNLEIIEKYDLGWVAEDPLTMNKTIKMIVDNPKILETKKDNLSKLAKKNYETGILLREKVKEFIGD